MRELTPEQMGLNYEALIKLIGPERLLKHFGLEALLDAAAKEHGDQKIREWLERRSKTSSGPDQPALSQK